MDVRNPRKSLPLPLVSIFSRPGQRLGVFIGINMKTEIIYKMIHENCKRYCDNNCPAQDEFRCCIDTSCQIVRDFECTRPETVELYDKTKVIPFLGPEGCVVSPEERKYCTTFICDYFAKTKYFKIHMKLIDRLPLKEKLHWKERIRFVQQGFNTLFKE